MSNLYREISSNARSVINVSKMVPSSGLSIISRAALGGKSKRQEEFMKILPDIMVLLGGLNLVDLFPSIKLLHWINAMRPISKKLHQRVDEILENIIMEHRAIRARGWTETDDLVYVLLDLQDQGELEIPLTTHHIKAILLDIFTTDGETSSTVVEWALIELLKNPGVMEKAQAEVRHVFASKGGVDEACLDELKCLNLVIKETLRLHAIASFLGPRPSTNRCEINGYEIPEKSRVIISAWAIGRDPNYWTETEKFFPETFLDSTIDYEGNCFEFIPSGAGRRICPGMSFGMASVEITMANLLYHFDWKLPGGEKPEDLDMTEFFSLVTRRKHDLCLVPIPYHPTHMS